MEPPNAPPDPADTAQRAHNAAKQRALRDSDTLLVVDMVVKDGENKVKQISTNKMKDQGVATLLQRAPPVREPLPGARTAQRVFMAQDSACLTLMTVQGESTHSMLPAGVPVIDHLAAWCKSNPGWDTLLPTINRLRIMRVPSTLESKHPEVLEVAVGLADDEEYRRAAEWVRQKHQQSKELFGFNLPAADVENIQLKATADFDCTERLYRDMHLGDAANPTYNLYPDPQSSKGGPSGKAVSMPVLLMYGGIGWQLHLRISAGHKADTVSFITGTLPPSYRELIETLEPAVGTGVEKDYAEFFEAIQTLYGDTSRPRRPIELTRLTLLAGCAISHTAVLQLVYTFLGGYLCKDWRSSTGDRLWSRPYEFLPNGLKCYLHGDIQQVAVTAWVAVTTWVAHLFPDSTLVTRCTNLMPMGLLNWWAEFAVKGLMITGAWNEPRPGYTTHREGAIQKAGVPRTESSHELLRLCPTWPAITSGGYRESHVAGLFL
jgi:hypothetical protein